MALTRADLDAIRQIVREELAAPAPQKPASADDPGTGRAMLPVREYTEYEVSNLIEAFPGINESMAAQMLKYRTVADSADYIRSAFTKFSVHDVRELPHNVFQTLGTHARYAGPFPWGWADVPSVDGTEE